MANNQLNLEYTDFLAQGETALATFLKKVLVQATMYGFNTNKITSTINYDVNRNPITTFNSSDKTINLIDYVIWQAVGVGSRNIAYNSQSYINIAVHYILHDNMVFWYGSEQKIDAPKNGVLKSTKIEVSLSPDMINVLRFLYSLKSLVSQAQLKTLVANNTVLIKLNGYRGADRRNQEGITKDLTIQKSKFKKELGSWLLTDSQDDISVMNLDASGAISIKEDLNKEIAGKTGFPLSYITGENTHGMNASGENEILAIHESLKVFYGIFLQPFLNAIKEKDIVENKPSPQVELAWNNQISQTQTDLSNVYGAWYKVPKSIRARLEEQLGIDPADSDNYLMLNFLGEVSTVMANYSQVYGGNWGDVPVEVKTKLDSIIKDMLPKIKEE